MKNDSNRHRRQSEVGSGIKAVKSAARSPKRTNNRTQSDYSSNTATRMELISDVIVVGAGAAGLLAAIRASELGLRTILLEKNRRPGIKILMSGGTRCNVTQNTDHRGIIEAFQEQGRFLRTAIGRFGPPEIVQFLADENVPTKIESTGKIFPTSDRAADVLQAFLDRLDRTECQLETEQSVLDVSVRDDNVFLVQTEGKTIETRNVILTTG